MENERENKTKCCYADKMCSNDGIQVVCSMCGKDANYAEMRVDKKEWEELQFYKLQRLADMGVPIEKLFK